MSTPHEPGADVPDDPDIDPLAAPDGEGPKHANAGSAEELAMEHSDVLRPAEPRRGDDPDQAGR
jgi:hypothetical protein